MWTAQKQTRSLQCVIKPSEKKIWIQYALSGRYLQIPLPPQKPHHLQKGQLMQSRVLWSVKSSQLHCTPGAMTIKPIFYYSSQQRVAHLRVFPPAKVVSAVVLPHRVTAGSGVWVGRRHGQRAGGRGQPPDAVELQVASHQVTHSHRPKVECEHLAPTNGK